MEKEDCSYVTKGKVESKVKNIFVTHSESFDYKKELYLPIKESKLSKDCNILYTTQFENFEVAREVIRKVDFVFCEVTFPTIEIGIEMEWARNLKIPIICAAFKGGGISQDIHLMSYKVIEYGSSEELLMKLKNAIDSYSAEKKMNSIYEVPFKDLT